MSAPKSKPAAEQHCDTVQALVRSMVAAMAHATSEADMVRYDIEVEAPHHGLNRIQVAAGGVQAIRRELHKVLHLIDAIEAIKELQREVDQ